MLNVQFSAAVIIFHANSIGSGFDQSFVSLHARKVKNNFRFRKNRNNGMKLHSDFSSRGSLSHFNELIVGFLVGNYSRFPSSSFSLLQGLCTSTGLSSCSRAYATWTEDKRSIRRWAAAIFSCRSGGEYTRASNWCRG